MNQFHLPLSEAGSIKVVELWVSPKYQARLNNTSDTVQSVFEHIHADFVKAVRNGELPSTDERSAAALRKKCVLLSQTQLSLPAFPPQPRTHPCRVRFTRAGLKASGASSSSGAMSRSEPLRTPAFRPTRWKRRWTRTGGALTAIAPLHTHTLTLTHSH